nr:MAG TPA: hypothetical protein [Caudoviricetes sp.]
MRDFSKYFNLDYMMNNVKKIVIVKKWYLDGSSTKVVDVDAKVFDREECSSVNDFKRDMAFVLGAISMLKLSRGVVHEATGMHIFEFDALNLDKRGRQLKLEMYYEEY